MLYKLTDGHTYHSVDLNIHFQHIEVVLKVENAYLPFCDVIRCKLKLACRWTSEAKCEDCFFDEVRRGIALFEALGLTYWVYFQLWKGCNVSFCLLLIFFCADYSTLHTCGLLFSHRHYTPLHNKITVIIYNKIIYIVILLLKILRRFADCHVGLASVVELDIFLYVWKLSQLKEACTTTVVRDCWSNMWHIDGYLVMERCSLFCWSGELLTVVDLRTSALPIRYLYS